MRQHDVNNMFKFLPFEITRRYGTMTNCLHEVSYENGGSSSPDPVNGQIIFIVDVCIKKTSPQDCQVQTSTHMRSTYIAIVVKF